MNRSPDRPTSQLDAAAVFARSVWDDDASLLVLLDTSGEILDLNRAMAESLGKPAGELKGTNIWERLHVDNLGQCRHTLHRVVASGRPERFETSCNGRWFESVLRPCVDDRGVVFGVSMLSWDTTALHGENESVSERRLKFTLESTNVGLWEYDLTSGSGWRSPEHARIFGYPDASTRWDHSDFLRHVSHADRPLVTEAITAGRDAGKGWSFECRIRRLDHEERWIWVNCGLTLDASGRAVRASGVVLDLTERKLAQLAVQESEARFAAVANSAPVLIWMAGLDKLCGFFNKPWLEFTGRTMEQEYGNGWAEGVHPEDFDRCLDVYVSSFDARKPFQMEYRLRRHDGEYRWILDHGVPRYTREGLFAGYIGSCIDITRQKDAEAASRENEARLNRVIEGGQAATWEWNIQTGEAVFNERWAEIIGRTLGELGPLSIQIWRDLVHPEDLGRFEAEFAGALSHPDRHYDCECRMRHRSGDWVWVHDRGKVVAWSRDGEPVRMVGTQTDITARKRMELALRNSEERLREVLENSIDASYKRSLVSDSYDYISPVVERITGWSAEEMRELGLDDITELFHPDEKQAMRERLAEAIADPTQQTRELEYRFKHRSGHFIWLHDRFAVLRDAAGRPTALIGSIGDVTGRKNLETSLRRSEEQHRLLFQNAGDAMLVVSPEHRILAANDMACRELGYAHEELVTMSIPQIVTEEVLPHLDGIVESVRRQAETMFEAAYRRKDGSVMLVEVQNHLVRWDGGECCLVICRDLTKRKQAEERLRQSQKMEAVGHLAGGMAHEFNNILAGMMMNLGMARMGGDGAEQQRRLEDLEESCRRSADLIKQLLAFSRQSIMSQRPLDFGEVVTSYVRVLKPFLGERVRLEILASAHLPLVLADKALLEQVLLNLCLNARDAMPNGGRLRLELHAERVGEDRAKTHPDARVGHFVRLSVIDTGCGMDQQTMRRLFEPFFTTKAVGQGTGLGLATVRGIVQQHQGWVEVESKPDSGSTFRVFLPALESAPVAMHTESPPAAPASSANHTILVVEDDAQLRALSAMLLRRQGYRVLEAEDSAPALALWGAHRDEIDLLYADMVMPGKWSGLELAERFRAEKPTLKVILTSGHNTDLKEIEAAAGAAITYLPKPCSPKILLSVIRQCLPANTAEP